MIASGPVESATPALARLDSRNSHRHRDPNAAMRTLVRYSRAAPVGTPGGSMLTAASAEGGVRG
jgi:hypothetical protein